MKNSVFLILFISVLLVFPLTELRAQPDTADTIYVEGFAISKAFLQELKEVIDYDSTDFLTYELNYYKEILKNEPRLDELRATAERYLNEYSDSYQKEDYESALTSYKAYLAYKDSINTILNARNVTDLNEQYNTAEKQKNIEVMNRENHLKSLGLEKRKQLKFILYFASAFLLIFLLITINFVRLKILKKKRLKVEVKARRLAEDQLWQKKRELEDQVETRKNELLVANDKLQSEIIELEVLQQKIFKAERLKIVGEMAAGMVEVIEEPVHAIVQEVGLLSSDEKVADTEFEDMRDILSQASDKVNDILQKLNQYSLADRTVLQQVDLNLVISNSVNLFKLRKLEKQIEFITKLSDKIPLLKLDKVKMEGILINLILNSMDAIEKRGVITIKTERVGEHVILYFQDNGCGIKADQLNEIFSPFYTTKKKGFGLGLSIIKRNLSAMGGEIDFKSEPGVGTRIMICFPNGGGNEKT